MKFEELKDFEDEKVLQLYRSYCDTFPEVERRNAEQFQNLFLQSEVKILTVVYNEDFISYLIIWQLTDFVFLEHFEIFPEFRNQKFGGKILQHLSSIYPKIVLESEHTNANEFSARRVDFYKRNTFEIISADYIQPSYGDSKAALELLLLANYKPENMAVIIDQLYNVVYA